MSLFLIGKLDNFYKNMRKVFTILTLSLVAISALWVFWPKLIIATQGETPFGGFTTYVYPCTCSGNFMIFHTQVAGPSPVMYQPGVSKVYPFSKITDTGVWLLGNLSTNVDCRSGHHCHTIGTYPMITIVGTSDPAKTVKAGTAR